MGKDTKTISVGQLCPKLYGKIAKTAEKMENSPNSAKIPRAQFRKLY